MANLREMWQSDHMHLTKRKGGALFAVLGTLAVAEGFGLFGEPGPAIQVVIGFVSLAIGIWFCREWWRSHKRIFHRRDDNA